MRGKTPKDAFLFDQEFERTLWKNNKNKKRKQLDKQKNQQEESSTSTS